MERRGELWVKKRDKKLGEGRSSESGRDFRASDSVLLCGEKEERGSSRRKER